ncbi:MAG: MgtC/SapB family protein [bacterium]
MLAPAHQDINSAMEMARVLRLGLLFKLLLAVMLGGIIGFERELAGKPAGLRTNILICIGATLLMDLSIRVGLVDGGARIGDPSRIAAQVVTGVGFLGAGTIMQSQGIVTGLTSAATIWVVAAIGMAIGAGFYIEGLGAGLLVTFVLAGLGRLEHWVRRARRVGHFTIRTKIGTAEEDIIGILRVQGLNVESRNVYDHPEDRTFELRVAGPSRQFDVASAALMSHDYVYGVNLG